MTVFVTILLFLIGVALIVKGGDIFVDAASWIAEISGIPKLIIGATIVSIATTLPENIVSCMAAAQGKIDMSIGNAVGSVTANIGLIMAISILCMPSAIKRKDYLVKSVLMLLASAVIVVGGFFGKLNLPLVILLIVILAVFIYENVHSAIVANSKEKSEQIGIKEKKIATKKDIVINILKFVLGAAGIVFGADLLVDNGSELARLVGVSERIIGVTIIAIGTSLPELVTTITAVIKKQSSLSLGNILGANILDLTMILPLSSLFSGQALPISSSSAMFDLPACLLVGAIAIIPTLITSKFKRWQGFALLSVYAVYMVLTCVVTAV